MEAITDWLSSVVLFLFSLVAVLIVHQTFKRLRTAASNSLPLEVRIEPPTGADQPDPVCGNDEDSVGILGSEDFLRISKTSC